MNIVELKEQLKALNLEYVKMKTLSLERRKAFGIKLNEQKQELLRKIAEAEAEKDEAMVIPLDITAPGEANKKLPRIPRGSKHPLMIELDRVIDIYSRMGFNVMESRQLDDEFHMFESLNFPEGHPSRDCYDTFRT